MSEARKKYRVTKPDYISRVQINGKVIEVFTELTVQDINSLCAIKEITSKGDDVEVKDKGDGVLTLYKVRKSRCRI